MPKLNRFLFFILLLPIQTAWGDLAHPNDAQTQLSPLSTPCSTIDAPCSLPDPVKGQVPVLLLASNSDWLKRDGLLQHLWKKSQQTSKSNVKKEVVLEEAIEVVNGIMADPIEKRGDEGTAYLNLWRSLLQAQKAILLQNVTGREEDKLKAQLESEDAAKVAMVFYCPKKPAPQPVLPHSPPPDPAPAVQPVTIGSPPTSTSQQPPPLREILPNYQPASRPVFNTGEWVWGLKYLTRGDYQLALNNFKKLYDVGSKLGTQPAVRYQGTKYEFNILMKIGEAYEGLKRPEDAIKAYKEAFDVGGVNRSIALKYLRKLSPTGTPDHQYGEPSTASRGR